VRKVLLALAAAVIALSAAPAAAAFAASSPVLTCNIQPNSNDVFHATSCGTTKVASSYSVDYYAQGGSGTYTYAWTWPSGYSFAGCTSSSDFCILQGVRAFEDLSLVATVVIKQGSSSTTQSVTARLNAVCGNMLC
jgi:hypothetical protein